MHSALKLPIEDAYSYESATSKYKALGGEALQDARQAWCDVQYLIIGEISMVSSTMLMHASKRLKDITGKHEAFGGLSVIIDGDFYQLPPVKAPFVFHRPTAIGVHCSKVNLCVT